MVCAEHQAGRDCPVHGPVETIWFQRTKRLVEMAYDLVGTEEIGPILSAAMMCENIDMGIADPDEMDGYPFPAEEPDESACKCTPEQRATGGFKSVCPVHGRGYRGYAT